MELNYRRDLNGPWPEVEDRLEAALQKGEFCYHRDEPTGRVKWLTFYPHDCPSWMTIPISPQCGSNGHTWTLSGTEEKPTLSPSVNWQGVWHGWLVDGVAKLA